MKICHCRNTSKTARSRLIYRITTERGPPLEIPWDAGQDWGLGATIGPLQKFTCELRAPCSGGENVSRIIVLSCCKKLDFLLFVFLVTCKGIFYYKNSQS